MLTTFQWGVNEYRSPCVFLLGGFDGIHLGHKKLLNFAKQFNLPVGMMTILGGKGKTLFTPEERKTVFREEGLAFAYLLEFTDKLKNTEREGFLEDILNRFNVTAFVCGKDFRFGKGAQGTPDFIREYTNLPVYDLDIMNVEGKKISTSVIKERIVQGKIEEAQGLLSYPFFVSGRVEEGRKVGRRLGFPTANMSYPAYKLLPREGVYGVHMVYDEKKYVGICNVGACPTFGVEERRIESYFDGFHKMIYGERIEVVFDSYLRDIQNFCNGEALVAQLKQDIRRVKQ